MRAYWILCSLTVYVAGCCAGQCVADDGLSDARARLELIEKQRQQAEEIAKQAAKTTSADSAEELANDTPLPPSADVLPIADPISTPPVVTFSTVVSASERKERLPRGLLLHGEGCIHCVNMERELGELCGDSSAPIEIVKTWLANDLEKLGVKSSMMIHGTPLLIVLGADGKIHSLTPSGFGCYLSGFHDRGEVIKYLSLPEHGVDLTPAPEGSEVIANVDNGDASPELFAAVLAAHIMESSGQETDDSPIVVGSLFDFTISVEDSWKQLARSILSRQSIEFQKAGLSVDWSGAERSFSIKENAITIQPPVKMTVNKWVFRYSVGLQAVAFADDLSYVRLDLSGAPDVTIRLVGQ
jgi:hypothetical protein